MSFVDSLMDMLKNGKEEDGAAMARNNLSQTWDYPSLVAALPYRYYDDRNEIFVNAGSAGFIMEAAPLPGANEQVMAALDDMLRKKLPRQTPVTVIMLASKCVGERIDRGVSNDMWKGGMAEHLNKINGLAANAAFTLEADMSLKLHVNVLAVFQDAADGLGADVSALAGDIAPHLTHNKAAVSVELLVVGHLNVALQANGNRAGILLAGDAGVRVGTFNQNSIRE